MAQTGWATKQLKLLNSYLLMMVDFDYCKNSSLQCWKVGCLGFSVKNIFWIAQIFPHLFNFFSTVAVKIIVYSTFTNPLLSLPEPRVLRTRGHDFLIPVLCYEFDFIFRALYKYISYVVACICCLRYIVWTLFIFYTVCQRIVLCDCRVELNLLLTYLLR